MYSLNGLYCGIIHAHPNHRKTRLTIVRLMATWKVYSLLLNAGFFSFHGIQMCRSKKWKMKEVCMCAQSSVWDLIFWWHCFVRLLFLLSELFFILGTFFFNWNLLIVFFDCMKQDCLELVQMEYLSFFMLKKLLAVGEQIFLFLTPYSIGVLLLISY